MPSKKTDPTTMRNGKLFCTHCGGEQVLPLPMDIRLAADFMKSFAKIHRNCTKTWVEPVNDNSKEKSEDENCNWWMTNGEHGISSKTMFNHLAQYHHISNNYESPPSDPSDFYRCYKLLKAIPQFRSRLSRLATLSPVWEKLVMNWDKLETMLEEQIQTNKANGMYEFMKSLHN